jgi:hypothetical protein
MVQQTDSTILIVLKASSLNEQKVMILRIYIFRENKENEHMTAASKKEEETGYFESLVITSPSDARLLGSEGTWDVLDFVHSSVDGVRPKEVADKFGMRLNQAYDKLAELEANGFVKRKKERGSPGAAQQRKTLVYVSSAWGNNELRGEFEDVMDEKFGKFVMDEVRPVLLKYFATVLKAMKSDQELAKWLPAGHHWCPDCGIDHQAWELFRALSAHAEIVVEQASFEWHEMLLENNFVSRKMFDEYTAKKKHAPDWALSDHEK